MKQHAAERIKDLKSRGFENAGLYDPPGVGGTHVMYVLHHADKPEIYAELPKNPRISPIVVLWKGLTKYAGLAAMGGIAASALCITWCPVRTRYSRRTRTTPSASPGFVDHDSLRRANQATPFIRAIRSSSIAIRLALA